jgi:GTP-binding protein
MLIDRATIFVHGGKGGDGCMSFRREKFMPKGGPDGGSGGNGGDVILCAVAGVDTLLDMAGRHHRRGEDGMYGMGSDRCGRNGEDLEVPVPPGTLIYDDATGELLVDLDVAGKRFVAAKGGKGGRGNANFKSSINQSPRQVEPGTLGEQGTLRLELKLIADVGFVGKPNAGKSTLLSRCSAARPKVADYPFTTLQPQLGIAELSGHRRLVLADIPGLIEGAHEGHGLGHDFLRHIERTRFLVHVLEIEPIDGSDPIENHQIICRELSAYSKVLASKPQILAINKMDLLGTEEDRDAAVELIASALGIRPIPISAVSGLGVEELLEKCWYELKGDHSKE